MNPVKIDELLERWREGVITADELRELADGLQEPELRTAFLEDWLVESSLPDVLRSAAVAEMREEEPAPESERWSPGTPTRRSVWLQWRPLTAAAAGLVFGMFCTSMLWAYVAPLSGKTITLLQESFESGPRPMAAGVPAQAGRWGGDYSDVVGEHQGVSPASGQKMLRFLRGDHEARALPDSHSSDVFQLVDVRHFRPEFADGSAVVQLAALFNAAPFAPDETFDCTLTIFALDAEMAGNGSLKADLALSRESLAFSRSSKVKVDRDPGTWQKVTNELRLPANTDFLMIRLGMSNITKAKPPRRDSFEGHYADKVQLVLAHRPEISTP